MVSFADGVVVPMPTKRVGKTNNVEVPTGVAPVTAKYENWPAVPLLPIVVLLIQTGVPAPVDIKTSPRVPTAEALYAAPSE